jgi:hypothetical protein
MTELTLILFFIGFIITVSIGLIWWEYANDNRPQRWED